MYVADLRFDQPVSPETVERVAATVLNQPSGLATRAEIHHGDFPYLVRIVMPSSDAAPSLEQFQEMARVLHLMFLTDDVAVGELWDDGFSLIGPDGFTAVLRVDDDAANGDNLVLYPESRDLYRAAVARLHAAAAD